MKGKWGLIEIICKESNNILNVFINCCEYVYENKEKMIIVIILFV